MPFFWLKPHPLSYALLPLAALFKFIIWIRRRLYQSGYLSVYQPKVPLIVVGNITAGGSGKTPLVIWLSDYLQKKGHRVAIISRGYGGHYRGVQRVDPNSDPRQMGDEPVLLAQRTGCPVYICKKRALAAQAAEADCDYLIADDGLQHYALGRQIEIAVINARIGLGNGFLIPAGPLREPPRRLQAVDLIISQGYWRPEVPQMNLHSAQLYDLRGRPQAWFAAGTTVHAVAGIADPQRFFDLLRQRGLQVQEHIFADHHPFQASDLDFGDQLPVIMTEKDAVKCRYFAQDHFFQLKISLIPETRFIQQLEKKIDEQKTA